MTYRSYDRVAEVYDYTRKIPVQSIQYFKDKIYSFLEEKFNLPNYAILSIGSGTGRIESSLSSKNHNLFGIDISLKMLKIFDNKIMPTPSFLAQADGLSLPFRKKFDLVTAVHFVHLITDYNLFYNEVTKISPALLIGYSYIETLKHPYYIAFNKLLSENKELILQNDDPKVQDFHQFMDKKGIFPTKYVSEVKTEIRNSDIIDSLRNRYFGSLWEIDDDIFNKTLEDFNQFHLNENNNYEEIFYTSALTELFFYEFD